MAGSGTVHLRRDKDDLVLQVEHLVVDYPSRRGAVHAVSDVSFDLADHETVGIVGESGCGKSTTGKAILRVPPPTSGRVLLDGVDLSTLGTEELRRSRSQLQMIFQDAISSLNPRHRIRGLVGEPLEIAWLESFRRAGWIRLWERYVPWMLKVWRRPWIRKVAVPAIMVFFIGLILWVASTAVGGNDASGVPDGGAGAKIADVLMIAAIVVLLPIVAILVVTSIVWLVLSVGMPIAGIPRSIRIRRARGAFQVERDAKVHAALTDVGIDADSAMDRRPHEFSGGQAQRICIARALVLDPKVIICDEPVSALDVSVQAQVLNLLEDLKAKHGISLVFIAHDLAVVKNIADTVVVMYLGKICEVAPPDELFVRPLHPYTEILMSSIPVTDPSVDPRQAISITGELPSPLDPPSGCRFRTRCPRAGDRCAVEEPLLRNFGERQFVACHFPIDHPDADHVNNGRAAVG